MILRQIGAEEAVLGAILLDGAGYWQVADLLAPEDFTVPAHIALWRVIADLARQNVPIDIFTVGEKAPALIGLAANLANTTPTSRNVRAYAEPVAAAALLRRVHTAGQRISTVGDTDPLGEAQAILQACAPPHLGTIKHAREFLRESQARMQTRIEAASELIGVPCGIPKLDAASGGWERGDLVILAARPSVGKTAVSLQWALHAAARNNAVLYVSLEMAGSHLTDRALAHLSGVHHDYVRRPKLMPDADWPLITDAVAKIAALPLRIDDCSAPTVDQLCARIRQAHAAQPLALVVIDYLSQITPPRANSTNDGIQIITRQLKALAKQLQVPIILLSQLNRDVAGRPRLANLRDSGAIEQDADIVIFLHRPNESRREQLELLIGKNRNGPLDEIQLYADFRCQRFSETTWEQEPVVTRSNSRLARRLAPQYVPYGDN